MVDVGWGDVRSRCLWRSTRALSAVTSRLATLINVLRSETRRRVRERDYAAQIKGECRRCSEDSIERH